MADQGNPALTDLDLDLTSPVDLTAYVQPSEDQPAVTSPTTVGGDDQVEGSEVTETDVTEEVDEQESGKEKKEETSDKCDQGKSGKEEVISKVNDNNYVVPAGEYAPKILKRGD